MLYVWHAPLRYSHKGFFRHFLIHINMGGGKWLYTVEGKGLQTWEVSKLKNVVETGNV